MKKRLPALVSAGVLSLFAVTALASAAASDYAKGKGATLSDKFSFSAQGTGLGDRANGNSTEIMTGYDPNVTITGNVTCMMIVGRMATIGGQITGFKPAGAANTFGNPRGFVIFATDNSKPSNGLDGYFYQWITNPPAVCPTPSSFSGNVVSGDIEIIPGP
jgi:hypothetical protein